MDLPDVEEHPHVVRVGWSSVCSDMTVGNGKYSYGYGGTGKFSNNGKFQDFNEPFDVGDVIGCYIVS